MAKSIEGLQQELDQRWSELFRAEKEAQVALDRLIDAAVEKIKADQALGKATGAYNEAKARALENEYISLLQRRRLPRTIVKRLTDTGWLGRFLSLMSG
jgi:phage gp16-like protein